MANSCKYMIGYIFFSCFVGFIALVFFVQMNIHIYGLRDDCHNYWSSIIFNGYSFVGVQELLLSGHLSLAFDGIMRSFIYLMDDH